MTALEKKEDFSVTNETPTNMYGLILLLVEKNPELDPDKVEKFLNLQLQMEDRQAKTAFNMALAKFQAECPAIIKNKKVGFKQTSYEYAQIDEMVTTIRPHLANNGLSFSFDMKEIDAAKSLLTIFVKHKDGHIEESTYIYDALDGSGSKSQAQARKSALTYAKRAALENALGLTTANEDDDAKRKIINEKDPDKSIAEIRELISKKSFDEKGLLNVLKIKSFEEIESADPKDIARAISGLRKKGDK